MSNTESVPQPEEMTPEESGVPGGDAEARVDEEVKVPSPASVPGETKDVGTDRKRENSPEIERGDFKRLCATLGTQLPSVLEKLHEGYRLTAEALQAVNENTALEKQIQKDLSELARSHGSEHVNQKYFLSIMQENLKRAENVEWQIAGPRADQHVSLKTVLSKCLDKLGNIHVGQQAMVAGIKEGNAAIKEGNAALTEAIKAGFAELAQSLSGVKDPPGGSSVPAMPPVGPSYGMPGYASTGYTMPATTPMTPSIPPAPTVPAPAMPSAPAMTGAPIAEQPPMALRLVVKDEAGNPRRVAVSPTRHAPGSKLPSSYLEEFGLGPRMYSSPRFFPP